MGQMILICEGTDCSGKSSVAKALAKRLNIPYYKGKGPTSVQASIKDRAITELNQITEFLSQTEHSVIIDRNYLSEWVYGSVFHREIDLAHLREIDEKYSELKAVNLIFTATDEELEKRLNERGDKMIDLAGITMVKEKYQRVMDEIQTPYIVVDTTDYEVEDTVDVIMELLEILKEDGLINL